MADGHTVHTLVDDLISARAQIGALRAEVEEWMQRRDLLREQRDAALAEVAAMRPVVEAAKEWKNALPGEAVRSAAKKLAQVVFWHESTYRASSGAGRET